MASRNAIIKLSLFALTFALLFACSSETVLAKKRTPRFKDYPVADIYKGKIAPLKLTNWDENWRARFQWAIENLEVDYAGRYIVMTWSCGSTCMLGVAINAKTGRVSWWDVRLNYGVEKPVDYRANSSLIIISGCRGGVPDEKTGIHYFKIRNGRFVHQKSVPSKQRPKPDCS